jgi:iron complex transport system permease protein
MSRVFFLATFILLFVTALAALWGASGFNPGADILWTVRLPRVVTALFSGAAVAVAGALSQSLFRNALASPSITGTESGAAFALALATLMTASTNDATTLQHPYIYTSIGAAAAMMIAITFMGFSINGYGGLGHLLLGGFAMNALLAAGTALCVGILMERGNGMSLYHWLMGSFSARTWSHAAVIGSGSVLIGLIAWFQAPTLDALSMGDDGAKSIGIRVQRVRVTQVILISLLVGLSLSVGGALPFIGLIAPHFARLVVGPHLRLLIPISALFGASLTVFADMIARVARAPIDMDVGILTTIIGAPYFLWLLWRKENA